jgi:hypothetical protein
MGILVVILFLALSIWTLVAVFRRLRRQRASRSLWLAFSALAACGVAIGVWCACFVEYHLGTHFRIGSFPIPVVFFHFEDGQWVDFPVPAFQAWLAIAANIITITALATLPVWLLLRRHDRVA